MVSLLLTCSEVLLLASDQPAEIGNRLFGRFGRLVGGMQCSPRVDKLLPRQ